MRLPTRFLRSLVLCLLATALCTVAGQSVRAQNESAGDSRTALPRVRVLFLGDNGHHVPLERCRDAYSALAKRGIDLTYSDDLSVLNPQTLGRYDALLLYANWEKITPEQEKALIDYVESGHGFDPIHCASFCFLNSPKITALIGGRFKSHQTGVFKETIAQPDHPIEKGLKPIESWDETYVHEMHNEQGRTVLGYRVEGEKKEPYTWTRTQGKGRVFYTAWGHDERTWTNENFIELLERGVRWSAGDWAMQPAAAPKAFSYVEAKVPTYVVGAAWGTAGKPISEMQEPVAPDESMKHMVVTPGFDVKLVCAEPQIKKPICMAFDERGRMWVAETFDYPNNMQEPGNGHDQITICESTKNDGVADKFTVFADKLSIPTSMCFANGGVIVAQAPDLLFFKDTKGDGKADVRKVLFTGFGTRDTHAGPSNLRTGFDGWIYGSIGYSGFHGTVGGQELSFGQGHFRFKPDGSKLEFLGSSTNNTWGIGLSEDNEIFGSTANNNPSFMVALPNRYYEQVRGMNAPRLEMIADTQKFYPITEKVRQVDQFGAYTAGAGSAIYTARSFPQFYWNRVQFVAEPTGHILGQFEIFPRGSGYAARNDFNILASNDEWTAPIAAEVGPDGSLWVIDWYNFIVQHNPIPKGWTAGKGGAYETPLRDKRHGRVYRLIWKDGKPSQTYDLSKMTPAQMVDVLKSDNMLWRMHAQRLLTERGDRSVIPALLAMASDPSVDEIGLNPAAIHALWTIHALGGFDGSNADATAVAVKALHHASAGVRKAALGVLPRDEKSVAAILDGKMLADADPHVRKDALLALSEMPGNERAGEAIFATLASMKSEAKPTPTPTPNPKAAKKPSSDDRVMDDAAAIAACRHDAGFLKALFAAHPGTSASVPVAVAAAENVIPNPSFEEVEGARALPRAWKSRNYAGKADHQIDSVGHTGQHSLKISSVTGSDTSMFVDAPVDPHTDYRLSAWIKTQDLKKGSGQGALLNVHGTEYKTPAVSGTTDWQPVEITFNTGELTHVSINCLFGGWGNSTGTAWFDDVELTRAHSSGLPAKQGRVASVVISQYARRGPVDSVVATLSAIKGSDPALATVVVNGLASGWPDGAVPKLSDADVNQLREVMKSLPGGAKDRLLALAGRWNRRDLFPEQSGDVVAKLQADVSNGLLDARKRGDAARRLIAVNDGPDAAALILKQVKPTTPPDVQGALLDSLVDSHAPDVGTQLVGRFGELTPTGQKAALNLMLRKSAWTGALLDGIESGKVLTKDLLPQQWQVLTSSTELATADRAKKLQKKAGAGTADRKEIVAKFIGLADEKGGDPKKGRLVFEKNCMVCHEIDGKGGKVGPELTGVGARPKADILMQILDPNRAVEGTWRQWMCKTKDDVISGRIYAESRTSVEIMDATGQLHPIQRDEIQVLKATDKGLMPEGLEAIPSPDLVDLLAYLSTSTVKK